VNPAERKQKLVNKAESNNANAQRRIEAARRLRMEKFSMWMATTLVDGVQRGQFRVVNFDMRENGTCRFRAEAASTAGGHAQARPPPRSNPVPTPQGRHRYMMGRGDLHVKRDPTQHDAREGGRAPQESPLTHRRPAVYAASHSPHDTSIVAQTPREMAPPGHLGADSNISADKVRSVKDVTGATSPYVRAALLDTDGDENAAADGLLRQRQEELDKCNACEMQKNLEKEAASLPDSPPDQQFTCVGQQRPTLAQRIDPPGEAPSASSASSSSAAEPPVKDGKSAVGSKATTPHLGAPGKQPMRNNGQGDDQLKDKEPTGGRGHGGRGGGGRGNGDQRSGGGHRGGQPNTRRGGGPVIREQGDG